MTKVRILILAVVALVLLNVALVAFLLSHGPPPRQEGPKRVIIERLHFDAAQISAYEQIIGEHQGWVDGKTAQQKRLREELYALLQKPGRDGADSIATAIGVVQAQIELIHFKHFEAIEAICRPEQRSDFIALSQELTQLFRGPPPRQERP